MTETWRRTFERLVRMKGIVVPVAIGFVAGGLIFGLRGGPKSTLKSTEHVEHSHPGSAGETLKWTCVMHPQIQKNEPGLCPICGMDLVPVNSASQGEDDDPARVSLSPRAKTLAQLRTTEVQRKHSAAGKIRLLGRVEANEKTLRTVTAWTGGRIDRLYVNTTGERVTGGQPIAQLYSPEIFAAHQDLIVASSQVERLSQGAESSRSAAQAALRASRQRLALLGVPDAELVRLEQMKEPTTSVTIRTPFAGTVMERFATEGSYVTTGARLYSIANLSTLWIQLDAYESDLPLLSLNQEVEVEVEAYPGENFKGIVTFIDPTLDERRRTSKVRVEIDNKEGRLRPGMFAQATVASAPEKGEVSPLVIPSTAPLFTGRRAIVYVEVPLSEGLTYEARTVRLGPRLGSIYPVVAGLKENERIVTRGAFALDADLQIRGGESMMNGPDDNQPGMWDELAAVPRAELRTMSGVIAAYLVVQKALAADDLLRSQTAVETLLEARLLVKILAPVGKKAWEHFSDMLNEHSKHIAQANSIEQARKGFEGLSGTVVMILRVLGNPLDKALVEAHCPMARGSEGASWIQEGSELENSYFGQAMLSCGDVSNEVAPGEHLSTKKQETGSKTGLARGHEH